MPHGLVNDGIEAFTANFTIKHLSDSNNEPSKTTDIYLLLELDLNILHFFLFKVFTSETIYLCVNFIRCVSLFGFHRISTIS